MLDTAKNLIYDYLNSFNAFFIIAGVMVLLFIIYAVLSSIGMRSLRRIIRIMRFYNGNDIIRNIEKTHLSRRFRNMWEDYYTAFCNEDTVKLSAYLVSDDLFVKDKVLRIASRATAIIGYSLTVIGITYFFNMPEAEKPWLLCLLLALLSLEAFLEIFYALFEKQREKRIRRMLNEFEMLSLRKLPGKAVTFENKHLIDQLQLIDEHINSVCASINQVNARLDREYNFLKTADREKEE